MTGDDTQADAHVLSVNGGSKIAVFQDKSDVGLVLVHRVKASCTAVSSGVDVHVSLELVLHGDNDPILVAADLTSGVPDCSELSIWTLFLLHFLTG